MAHKTRRGQRRVPPPMSLPHGIRLALRCVDGRELPARLVPVEIDEQATTLPCTILGECPRRPPRPKKPKGDVGPNLFGPTEEEPEVALPRDAATIVVYHAACPDVAESIASQLHRRGYAATVEAERPAEPDPKPARKRGKKAAP